MKKNITNKQHTLTKKEHKQRHQELHQKLDELVADWIIQTGSLPSKATITDLIGWSYEQTTNPTIR